MTVKALRWWPRRSSAGEETWTQPGETAAPSCCSQGYFGGRSCSVWRLEVKNRREMFSCFEQWGQLWRERLCRRFCAKLCVLPSPFSYTNLVLHVVFPSSFQVSELNVENVLISPEANFPAYGDSLSFYKQEN